MAWDPLEQLSGEQRRQLDVYSSLLTEINQLINLISREDEEYVFERHILHALTLSLKRFPAGAGVVDWGTGGGLPAIPLGIAFPDVHFVAVDAVAKKVRAVRAMVRRLGLDNVETWHGRAEAFPQRASYSVSRATVSLRDLWTWHARVAVATEPAAGEDVWKPGLLCLKGGDLAAEIDAVREIAPNLQVNQHPLPNLVNSSYYDEKVILECFLRET